MNKYKIQTWYTLEEVLNRESWDTHVGFINFFDRYLNQACPIFTGDETPALKPYLEELLQLVYARFKDHYCCHNYEEDLSSNDKQKVAEKFANIIIITYDKYASLLDYYNEAKNKLMDPISSESESIGRFNDTPQNGGDFADDVHTTNITKAKTTNKIDGDTKINRLEEIENKLHSYLYKWSNEFDKMFIEEDNI